MREPAAVERVSASREGDVGRARQREPRISAHRPRSHRE